MYNTSTTPIIIHSIITSFPPVAETGSPVPTGAWKFPNRI
jgi:hypothetical protein